MSGHTQGRLVVLNSFLVPVAHADRKLGGSSDPKRDHDEYAHYIADVKGKRDYHDHNANARRLAAAWNACEDMPTDDIEELAACRGVMVLTVYADEMRENLDKANARIAKLDALVAERDAMLGKRPCQNSRCNELNAARALLREVIADAGIVTHIDACQRAQDYLDANTQTGEKE